MAKITLAKPTSGYNLAEINNNFTLIEQEFQNKVLYRDNPVGESNVMENSIDMNSNRILNLLEPLTANEPARLQDVQNAISGVSTANLVAFTPAGNISSTNVQAAIQEVDSEKASLVALAAPSGSALVGHIASGAGAVTTTVHSALQALSIPDYATLRTYTGAALAVEVTGFLIALTPAGIAGKFTRDDSDTTSADNGGTIIVAGTVRWKRQYTGPVNMAWFGAKFDEVTDDKASIQAAHDYLAGTTSGGYLVAPVGSTCKLLSGLSINTNKVGIDWQGAILNCTSFGNGVDLYTITQTESDVNKRTTLNKAHPIKGGIANGPGTASTARFAYLNDPNATQNIAGVTFKDGGCWNWSTGVQGGIGCFFTTFENYDFSATTGGGGMGTCISFGSAVNSGERNSFINCRFGTAQLYLFQSNGDADTFFVDCSFNYGDRMMTINAGRVYVTGYHVEGNTDADWFFVVSGADSLLSLADGKLNITGAKTAKEIIFCDSGVTHGGIILDNYAFESISAYPLSIVGGTSFVGGTGRVQARGHTSLSAGSSPVTSNSLNVLSYPDFESANYANDWVFAGTTPPARSNVNPHTFSWALRLAGISGENNSANAQRVCSPGQMVRIIMWVAVTGYNTGGNAYGQWIFQDSSGVAISTGAPMNITANQAYTRMDFGSIPPAPFGTAFVSLNLSFFGVTVGTPFAYVDDIIFNII